MLQASLWIQHVLGQVSATCSLVELLHNLWSSSFRLLSHNIMNIMIIACEACNVLFREMCRGSQFIIQPHGRMFSKHIQSHREGTAHHPSAPFHYKRQSALYRRSKSHAKKKDGVYKCIHRRAKSGLKHVRVCMYSKTRHRHFL